MSENQRKTNWITMSSLCLVLISTVLISTVLISIGTPAAFADEAVEALWSATEDTYRVYLNGEKVPGTVNSLHGEDLLVFDPKTDRGYRASLRGCSRAVWRRDLNSTIQEFIGDMHRVIEMMYGNDIDAWRGDRA